MYLADGVIDQLEAEELGAFAQRLEFTLAMHWWFQEVARQFEFNSLRQ